MVQDPFPDPGPDDPGPDDAEPGGFPSAEDGPGPEQGLYVTLPAEQLTLSGFAQGGEADTMAPGALLATVVDTVTGEDGAGLAGCSDDQLLGIISAARRLESRSAWTLMAAVGEFARRAGTGLEGEFAADELACELRMSQQSAAGQMDFAAQVARRLPETFAALAAGRIHPVHLRILEDETRILADADAAQADALLAGTAPGMTFGELRYAAHKLVLTLDPDAARKRKEAARREAHVRRFREESGNAGMVARELPSDEVLAGWQHVEQRALELRAAGMPGSLQDLRVRAYLDLLQERDSRALAAGPAGAGQPPPRTSPARVANRPVPATVPADRAALTVPADPVVPAVPATGPAARAAAAARAVPLPGPARLPGRAWPRWSPSPSHSRPSKAGPAPPAKPTGSASSTPTAPVTWPPPRPGTPAPGGASPR